MTIIHLKLATAYLIVKERSIHSSIISKKKKQLIKYSAKTTSISKLGTNKTVLSENRASTKSMCLSTSFTMFNTTKISIMI